MKEDTKEKINGIFEAMGNSGGCIVIGQVIGEQNNYFETKIAPIQSRETELKTQYDVVSSEDTPKPSAKEEEKLNYFAPTKNLQELLKMGWFKELRAKEEYDEQWTDDFIAALMGSEWKDDIARDWAIKGKREKKNQIKGYVIGLLVDAGVIKGSYQSVATLAGVIDNDRTFAKYMGEGKKQPYSEWVKEYVTGENEE